MSAKNEPTVAIERCHFGDEQSEKVVDWRARQRNSKCSLLAEPSGVSSITARTGRQCRTGGPSPSGGWVLHLSDSGNFLCYSSVLMREFYHLRHHCCSAIDWVPTNVINPSIHDVHCPSRHWDMGVGYGTGRSAIFFMGKSIVLVPYEASPSITLDNNMHHSIIDFKGDMPILPLWKI